VNGNGHQRLLPCARKNRSVASIRSQEGFTYIGILFVVALVGTQLAVAGVIWSFAQDRQKERELLFVGEQFRTAISRYYLNPQGPQKEYPKRLDDLVRDSRYPGTVRHIRKLYADPITGKVRWKLITTPDCSIIGVYSLSEMAPIKVGNFLPTQKVFEKKQRYSDWKFVAGTVPNQPTGSPASATPSPNASTLPSASRTTACPKIYSADGYEEEEKTGQSFTGSDLKFGTNFGEPLNQPGKP
jgi:type II secretory pathway pseudopilin PulG